jgi:hypothetical protein
MRRARRTTTLIQAAVVGLAVLVCGRDELQAQSEPSLLLRIRTRDPDVQRAVTSGSVRSQTFHTLVEAIEQSRLFVYIVRVPYLPGKMEGCVAMDAAGAGEDRYLRMFVKSGLHPNRLIVVIGHEFQHVLEILGEIQKGKPDRAFDLSGLSQLGTRQYETQYALDAEVRIAAELRSQRDLIRAGPNRGSVAR